MKYCPVCHERYDEEIIQFCTKDGTPLLEEEQPSFTRLPSEDLNKPDDIGEETVIRRRPGDSQNTQAEEPERIVIPTSFPPEQPIRPRPQVYYPPPQEPNTVKTVVLTILGTLVVLGFGAGLFWLLQKEQPANIFANVNNANLSNQNANVNTNLAFDSNFNFNTNANFNTGNFNFNMNLNANFRTPSPTPSPKPSPSPILSPSAMPSPLTSPTRPANVNRPSTGQTPRIGPRPTVDRPPPGNN
jgi:hypothetical protein